MAGGKKGPGSHFFLRVRISKIMRALTFLRNIRGRSRMRFQLVDRHLARIPGYLCPESLANARVLTFK